MEIFISSMNQCFLLKEKTLKECLTKYIDLIIHYNEHIKTDIDILDSLTDKDNNIIIQIERLR